MGNTQHGAHNYLKDVDLISLAQLDQDMLQEYRAASVTDLVTSYDIWMLTEEEGGEICGRADVGEEEFDEIFGCWIGDTEPFFNFWKRKVFPCEWKDGVKVTLDPVDKVSMYACFSGISAFVNGTMETKLGFIYNLFDFDQSGNLSKREMQILLKYTLMGLNRLASLELDARASSEQALTHLTKDIFWRMDDDRSNSIELAEFRDYVMSSRNVLQFLHHLQEATDIKHAIDQCKERWAVILQGFNDNANANTEISLDTAMSLLNQCINTAAGSRPIMHEEKASLTEHIDAQGKVSLFVFEALARGMIAFDIVDRSNNNYVHQIDLVVLLEVKCWVPSDIETLNKAVGVMNKHNNDDDMLTRLEWINFCAPPRELGDKGYYEQFGQRVQELFSKHDVDKSGDLIASELAEVLFESLMSVCPKSMLTMLDEAKNEQERKDGKGVMRKKLVEMANSLADELLGDATSMQWLALKLKLEWLWNKKVKIMQWLYRYQSDHVGRILGFDNDGSNTLDMDELRSYLLTALAHFTKYHILTQEEAVKLAHKTAAKIAGHIDKDGDGQINKDELDKQKEVFIELEAAMLDEVDMIRKLKVEEAMTKRTVHFDQLKKKHKAQEAVARKEREAELAKAAPPAPAPEPIASPKPAEDPEEAAEPAAAKPEKKIKKTKTKTAGKKKTKTAKAGKKKPVKR